MTKFEQTYCVQPIGQGLFYTGEIKLDLGHLETFRCVYDCGSYNPTAIKEEVEEYRNTMFPHGGELDLLIISHFHADHINHIKDLLRNDIRVKKIVIPFLDFNQRLVLALTQINDRTLADNPGNSDQDQFVLQLIIDPIRALDQFLSPDEGEILVIDSDPENPTFTTEETVRADNQGEGEGFAFDIPDKQSDLPIEKQAQFLSKSSRSTSYALDSKKGFIMKLPMRVIEFLFYRKAVGTGEDKFYEKVRELFFEKYKDKITDRNSPDLQKIVDILLHISVDQDINPLFRSAIRETNGQELEEGIILNANSTSLGLLHHSLPSFYNWILSRDKPRLEPQFDLTSFFVHKADGTAKTKYLANRNAGPYFAHWFNFPTPPHCDWDYPNTLLTSDAYYLKKHDTDLLFGRYRNYWEKFWLFQIPHHGSKNNAGISLFKSLSKCVIPFINYGAKKEWNQRWRFPAPEVIRELESAGLSNKLISVTEFTGLLFIFSYSG